MQEFYIKLRHFSLLYKYYAYVDVPDYLADQLFVKNSVYVYYDNEYAHPEHGFRVILCHVAWWRRRAFEAALKELPTMMALTGRGDYLDFCGGLLAELKKQQRLNERKA